MDLQHFDALTFDCYGTLIDWERGLLGGLRPVLEARGWSGSDDEALELFGSIESRIQSGPYTKYADVLRTTMDEIGSRVGFTPSPDEREALVRSLRDWPPFPDTTSALARLKRRFRLAVVSNIDDDLFAASAAHLAVPLDEVVTAEQVGSYKPHPGHFHVVLERLGLPRDRVLHVAQSLFHDIAPAKALGFSTVWVNRRAGSDRFGATPPASASPTLEVPDLATLAALAEGGEEG